MPWSALTAPPHAATSDKVVKPAHLKSHNPGPTFCDPSLASSPSVSPLPAATSEKVVKSAQFNPHDPNNCWACPLAALLSCSHEREGGQVCAAGGDPAHHPQHDDGVPPGGTAAVLCVCVLDLVSEGSTFQMKGWGLTILNIMTEVHPEVLPDLGPCGALYLGTCGDLGTFGDCHEGQKGLS